MDEAKYPVEVFWVDEDQAWFAVSPVFGPSVSSYGETPNEAISELQQLLELVADSYAQRGIPLPADYSGKLSLRIPRSLHAQLSQQAKAEDVSLNMLLVSYLSERAGRSEGT